MFMNTPDFEGPSYEEMSHQLAQIHDNAESLNSSWINLGNTALIAAALGSYNNLLGYPIKDGRLLGFTGSAIVCGVLATAGSLHANLVAESIALDARVLAADNSTPVPEWAATMRRNA
jgi:hypothetical protein